MQGTFLIIEIYIDLLREIKDFKRGHYKLLRKLDLEKLSHLK